jgi:hypothetical protein
MLTTEWVFDVSDWHATTCDSLDGQLSTVQLPRFRAAPPMDWAMNPNQTAKKSAYTPNAKVGPNNLS